MFFEKDKKKYFLPIIAIILFIVVFIIVFVLIKYIEKVDGFDTSTSTQPTTTQPTTTQATTSTMNPLTTKYMPLDIMNQILPAIGPCLNLKISSLDLNLAGVLILNQWGNNIFNNSKIQLSQNQISGFHEHQIVTTNEFVESKDISPLFENTHNIYLNNEKCNFDFDNKNTYPGYYIFTSTPLNIGNRREKDHLINQRKMFTTPKNVKTDVVIYIPNDNDNNVNITKIVLFLNPELNNINMLKSLEIELTNFNISLIKWSTVKTTINNDPPISVITFSLESNNKTITTQSGSSSFQNINSIKEQFNTLDLNISNIDNIDNNKVIPVPINVLQFGSETSATSTTLQSGSGTSTTLQSGSGTSTTLQSGSGTSATSTTLQSGSGTYATSTTLQSGSGTSATSTTLQSGSGTSATSTIPLTTYGYKIKKSLNPQTNLYQKNFDGTSNVYTPHIYHGIESFVPLSTYDDSYLPYSNYSHN